MLHVKPLQMSRARDTRARASLREFGIVGALEWAFGTEKAQLDFNDLRDDFVRPDVSGIYVLMQRGALGCQIDGGGHSRPHDDAELIASALAMLPNRLGGRAMAAQMAAMARAGVAPDWRANPQPRCVPRDWRCTKHGMFAATEKIGTVQTEYRGRKITHDLVMCPVTYRDTADEIAQIRAAYRDWWDALNWLRAWLKTHDDAFLRLRLSDDMPPRDPWRAIYHKRGGL